MVSQFVYYWQLLASIAYAKSTLTDDNKCFPKGGELTFILAMHDFPFFQILSGLSIMQLFNCWHSGGYEMAFLCG